MARLIAPYAELPSFAGRDLGFTDYRAITQDRINTFADATDDHQWIHVDPVAAADGPFGAPVAHGFLSLSLIVPFWEELFDVDGVTAKVNYGLDRVRFTSPVKVGARIRMHSVIDSIEEVTGGYQLKTTNTIEIDGQERPAVVAEFIARFYA
jgi:acyl dehydratase